MHWLSNRKLDLSKWLWNENCMKLSVSGWWPPKSLNNNSLIDNRSYWLWWIECGAQNWNEKRRSGNEKFFYLLNSIAWAGASVYLWMIHDAFDIHFDFSLSLKSCAVEQLNRHLVLHVNCCLADQVEKCTIYTKGHLGILDTLRIEDRNDCVAKYFQFLAECLHSLIIISQLVFSCFRNEKSIEKHKQIQREQKGRSRQINEPHCSNYRWYTPIWNGSATACSPLRWNFLGELRCG